MHVPDEKQVPHRAFSPVRNDKVFELTDMQTAEQTLDEILTLAAAHFKVGIDSLQTLDLLTKLENHFRVELPDYELQGVSDFRTLAGKIQARL